MRENRPDIGKMIEEELAKEDKAEGGKPLDAKELGGEAPKDEVDEAFERLTDTKSEQAVEAADAAKAAERSGEAARSIVNGLGKEGGKDLKGIAEGFIAEETKRGKSREEAVALLQEQLKGFHDGYFGAGSQEKAAEIDSFSRSIEAKSDVSTEAGKDFLAKLESGAFGSIEDANNALDQIAKNAKGAEADALNAEFNALFGKTQEHFTKLQKEQKGDLDIKDDDIDSALGALG